LHPTGNVAKQVPVAVQASTSGKPQMSPPAQSASLLQAAPVPPPSAAGAHWQVSHPLLSFSMPFGQFGKQPSPGHEAAGHPLLQPQTPSMFRKQTGTAMDPSEQTMLFAANALAPHSHASPASPDDEHAGKSHPH
jgi:hypothetical protein